MHKRNNNTQRDNAKYTDTIISMYNLIEYNDNYSKTFRSLWQYWKDIPVLNKSNNIDLNGINATVRLILKQR